MARVLGCLLQPIPCEGQVEFRFLSGKLEEQLQTYGPDVVAIGGVTQNFHHAVRCAAESKTRGAVVIVGGPHISALPSCLSNYMDIGCIGEGEQTFLELMQIALEARRASGRRSQGCERNSVPRRR